VTSDLILSAVDDFISLLDTGTAGKFPGSIAVYPSLYNGTVSVDQPKGNAVVKAAHKRIKILGNIPKQVLLVVCAEEIKVVRACQDATWVVMPCSRQCQLAMRFATLHAATAPTWFTLLLHQPGSRCYCTNLVHAATAPTWFTVRAITW
jgi:hypothetical protein